ncbi:hypothetical protein D3C81_1409820 [compost metagenome]
MQQFVTRGQGANGCQVQLLHLPFIAFVLAQFQLQDFDLRAKGKAFVVVIEVVISHAQAVLAKGFISTAAEAELPGAGLVTVFRQARLRDIQLRRRVLVDCPQQFEAALGACRVAFLAIGAVALQTIGRIDDQRLTVAGLRLERRVLQLFLIGADFQHPLLLFRVQRLGAAEQLALPGRTILDRFHQSGIFHGFDGVGRDGGEWELLGQAQARSGHLQQFQQAV